MTTAPTRSRVPAALLTGAATVLYYATPDVVRSRTARGWLKAGLTAVTFAASVPELRAMRAAARTGDDEDVATTALEDLTTMPTRRKVAGVGVAAAFVGSSVGGLVATERWIFHRGEARAAAGQRLPHTRVALLLGALSTAIALVPSPDDSADTVDVADA